MKKIAIFTSGGDSPGMNACIRAAVRTAMFNGVEVVGIERGFSGMINNEFIDLNSRSVSNIVQRGGTILKTHIFFNLIFALVKFKFIASK